METIEALAKALNKFKVCDITVTSPEVLFLKHIESKLLLEL